MTGLFKYSGAGNDFIILDGRGKDLSEYRHASRILALCDRRSGFRAADDRIGADGLMILSDPAAAPSSHGALDFKMEFFNPDGSSGMMCGNGGRCITAFADKLGIKPASEGEYVFSAADGVHRARILKKEGNVCIVRLLMVPPSGLKQYPDGWFINTGTRHFVKFVSDIESIDINVEGSAIRHRNEFSPDGTNADFVQILPDGSLKIRTFEKGVEAETLACGTGIVAAALIFNHIHHSDSSLTVTVHARKDKLEVEMTPQGIWLTGPAELIS